MSVETGASCLRSGETGGIVGGGGCVLGRHELTSTNIYATFGAKYALCSIWGISL